MVLKCTNKWNKGKENWKEDVKLKSEYVNGGHLDGTSDRDRGYVRDQVSLAIRRSNYI